MQRSGSINTTAIDPYRQGVEVRLPSHQAIGIAKIGTGELGGNFRRSSFGMSDALRCGTNSAFSENGSNSNDGPWSLDGTIEALSIRSTVMFAALDGIDDGHAVRGTLMGGTEDQFGRAAQISNLIELDEFVQQPFIDSSDVLGSIPLQHGSFSEPGSVSAADDSRLKSGIRIPQSAAPEILQALRAMAPATDFGLVPPGFIAAAAGFVYDTRACVGTDSIAFGGLKR